MNLQKLSDMQKVLDERIYDRFPDLRGQNNLDWKILALRVELSECAEKWRGFKKWSTDQEPRTNEEVFCEECRGTGTPFGIPVESGVDCWKCEGVGFFSKNPLLEEYVDCLHFILSIGLELKTGYFQDTLKIKAKNSILEQFNVVFLSISDVMINIQWNRYSSAIEEYKVLFAQFITLGEMLGFTWPEIEQAYFDKNAMNHQRQEAGY